MKNFFKIIMLVLITHTAIITSTPPTTPAVSTTEFQALSERVQKLNENNANFLKLFHELIVHVRTERKPTIQAKKGGFLSEAITFVIAGFLIHYAIKYVQGKAATPEKVIATPGYELYQQDGLKAVAGKIPVDVLEIIDFIKNPSLLQPFGISMPKGILLVGPPGNGKTILARAIAVETQTSFFYVSGSEVIDSFVGSGPARIRTLFDGAKASIASGQCKKSIIFIDEIDAIGGRRSDSDQGGSPAYRNTLNELLNQMDGFEQNPNVIVIAATNTVEFLDPALVRPGRFDRIVTIPNPDQESRLAIIKHYATNKRHNLSKANFERLAEESHGFSAADLKNMVNEAAIFAMRVKAPTITYQHFYDGLKKTIEKKEVSSKTPLAQDEITNLLRHMQSTTP